MAGRGSAPGERRGGRARGVPNKRTVEELERRRIEEIAKKKAVEASVAARAHIKLGKDVLEEFMDAFGQLAAIYQNQLLKQWNDTETMSPATLNEFERWGALTAKTAKDLADFQSPKFKSIGIMVPPNQGNDNSDGKTIDGKVTRLTDAVGAGRTYARIVKQITKQ